MFRNGFHVINGKRRPWWRSVSLGCSNARQYRTRTGGWSGDSDFMPDMGAEVGCVPLKLVGSSRVRAECVTSVCLLQTAFYGYLVRSRGSDLT